MRVTIESTSEFHPSGTGRIWRGTTANGVPVVLMVLAVGTESPEAAAAIGPEVATLQDTDPLVVHPSHRVKS